MCLTLNCEGFENYLDEKCPCNGGVQYRFKFENGYGASVVKHGWSYGSGDDLWELAVIKYDETGDWDLNYDTDITNDVIGWLSDEEIRNYLQQIKEL